MTKDTLFIDIENVLGITKDFEFTIDSSSWESGFDVYVIKDSGLYKQQRRLIANPEFNPLKEDGTPKDGFAAFQGSMTMEYLGERLLDDFHGDIKFYDEFNNFIARFSYGNLDYIKKGESNV
jgi:hypothetical protein